MALLSLAPIELNGIFSMALLPGLGALPGRFLCSFNQRAGKQRPTLQRKGSAFLWQEVHPASSL